jgi:hypothetical protein
MSSGGDYSPKVLILDKLKLYAKFGAKNKYFRGVGGYLSMDREQVSVKARSPDILYYAPAGGNSMQKLNVNVRGTSSLDRRGAGLAPPATPVS